MAVRNDLVVLVGMLLCLVLAANAYEGTASAVDLDAQSNSLCSDVSVSDNMIAIVGREIYSDGMCSAKYLITCDSNGYSVDPCNSENNQVTVTIIGVCDPCDSFQLSIEAYDAITNGNGYSKVDIQYEGIP